MLNFRSKEKKISKEVDAKTLSKTKIAKSFWISKVIKLSHQGEIKDDIENAFDEVIPSRKYFRKIKFPDLEKTMVACLLKMRINKMIRRILRVHMVAYKNVRYGQSLWKSCVECAAVDTTITNNWKEGKLESLTAEYAPENVFNQTEIGLFFNVLPEKTLALKGSVCNGG